MSALGDEIKLTGTVRDRVTGSYIVGAKVEIINENDSIVGEAEAIDYEYDYIREVLTEKANFELSISRNKGKYNIRISQEEYDTVIAPLDLTNIGAREHDRRLGTFYMDRHRVNQLKEVEVKTSKIFFYNRGDTLVYNADAFRLAEGSMLDELIKQLPGVELRDDGKIYVNGRFVESLLLNGKDFFKGNNRLMLDNLSAYTVKNIEVYKKQTDRAKFLGLSNDADKALVMDVKLKKDYIGGWNINTELAAGTEDRYLARVFAMNYRALSQLTFIANSNNLNDDTRPTAEDHWNPDNMTDGERKLTESGFDYSFENSTGKRRASGNIIYSYNRNLSDQITYTTTFLPEENTHSNSHANSLSSDYSLASRNTLTAQSSIVSLSLMPIFSFTKGKSTTLCETLSWLGESENINNSTKLSVDNYSARLINSALSQAYSNDLQLTIGGSLNSTIKVPKTSDAFDIYGSISHRSSKAENEKYSILRYGDDNIPIDARRQFSDNDPTKYTALNIGAKYTMKFNSQTNASINYRYDATRNLQYSYFYLGHLEASYTGDYTLDNLYKIKMEFDPTNSRESEEQSHQHCIDANFDWSPTTNFSFSAFLPIEVVNNNLIYRQDGVDYISKYNHTHLAPNFTLSYSKSHKSGSYSNSQLSYSRNYQMPMLQNLITIPNTRDPLSEYLGNPNLKPSTSNNYVLTIQHTTPHNFSLFAYISTTLRDNAIAQSYIYDTTTGKRTYQTINVDGNWSINTTWHLNWRWTTLNCNVALFGRYNTSCTHNIIGSSPTNTQFVKMNSTSWNPGLQITKYFGDVYNKP